MGLKFASIALEDIESRCTHFVLHFDVDVMNFIDFPLANIPTFNGGLSFQDAMTCLHIFAGSSKFAGLVITEINPNHTDENGLILGTFIQGLANALTLEKHTSKEVILGE